MGHCDRLYCHRGVFLAASFLRVKPPAGLCAPPDAHCRVLEPADVVGVVFPVTHQANERGIDGDIVKMVFSKALMTVGLWLVHPLLSHKYQVRVSIECP